MFFSDRHLRAQLPDLHLDDVGEGLSCGREPVRLADLDDGDRIGRPARCSPRDAKAPHVDPARAARRCSGIGCALAAIMPSYCALRRRAHPGRRVRADLHHLDEQPGAALDGARDARPGDGDSPRASPWAARRSARRSSAGWRTVRPALGAGRRRRRGNFCRERGTVLSGEASQSAHALRHRDALASRSTSPSSSWSAGRASSLAREDRCRAVVVNQLVARILAKRPEQQPTAPHARAVRNVDVRELQ